jgi:thiol-disulfide isomerase/thioredoxin
MADSPELDADGTPAADRAAGAVATDAAAPPDRATARAPRVLDKRIVAIAVVLGIAAALLTVLIASAFASSDDGGTPAMQLQDTDALLNLPLEAVDGTKTDLASFREDGQPTLVNLWQAACVPCVREMPMLDAAQADNPHIAFVGINTQESVAKAEKLAKQTGITYPWALDPDGEFYFESGAQGMPTTLLLDGSGAIISTRSGEFTSAAQLQTFLDLAN